ncbi:MAG: nucleotidyltransferase family protein [Xanthobacteraceae bacterium]|nr:nucleotidyltransferase family protein [Xanthobacteraceae bacterium]
MKRDDAIAILRQNADALKARGVCHAALFGSVARNEAGPASDLDIMIELAPDAKLNAFDYAGLKRYIADLFPGKVDVVNRAALKSYLRRPAESDAIYAF